MKTEAPGRGIIAVLGAFAVVLVGCAWVWNVRHVPQLTVDDGFVFARYARNWVDAGELTWNVGERGTDGFTSFAFTALSALFYLFHRRDIVTAVGAAGLASATVAVLASTT